MGADYEGQEVAISELSSLSPKAKEYLNHHISNALASILGAVKTGNSELVEERVWHIVDDLETAGIRPKFSRRF